MLKVKDFNCIHSRLDNILVQLDSFHMFFAQQREVIVDVDLQFLSAKLKHWVTKLTES